MEQVNSMLLELIQSVAQSTTARPQQSAQSEPDSFQKLMEQQCQQASGTEEKTGGTEQGTAQKKPFVQEQPSEPGAAVTQEQMLWAAAAMLSNPVVPMQQALVMPQAQMQTPAFVGDAAVSAPQTAMLPDIPQTVIQQSMPVPQTDEVMPQTQTMVQRPASVVAGEGAEQAAVPQQAVQQTAQMQTKSGGEQTAAEGEKLPEAEVTASSGSASAEPQVLFRDVEAVPVKVGEAPANASAAEPASVETQIESRLEKALAEGETRVEVRLEPESLGTVTVEVTHRADGSLHIVLSAESAQTRELLERHAPGLQGLLAGREPDGQVQVEVQRQQESHGQSADDAYSGARQGQQQEQQRQQPRHTQDFFQQLRLGLIPLDDIAS